MSLISNNERNISYIFIIFLVTSIITTASSSSGIIFAAENFPPEIDGIINPGEYSYNKSFSSDTFQLFWSFNQTTIYLGMKGKASGWISLGISPTTLMKDADMLFGWAENGVVYTADTYSTGNYGPHPLDTELGGTNDIIVYNGSESNGVTTIELVRLLDTGDEYDKPFKVDEPIDIIWAVSNSDDINAKHSARGSGTLNLVPQEGETGENNASDLKTKLWPYHAIAMLLGIALLISGIILNRFFKRSPERLKKHQWLEISASLISIIGLIIAIIMATNIRGVHNIIGLVSLPFVIGTPTIGYLVRKNLRETKILNVLQKHKRLLAKVHKTAGYTTLILMMTNLILGLLLAIKILF